MPEPYAIDYAPGAIEDLRAMRAFDRATVFGAIEQHLAYEPAKISRSRIKQMIQPFWSQFRLRSGDFRVYYDIEETPRRAHVLRILSKERDITPQEPPL